MASERRDRIAELLLSKVYDHGEIADTLIAEGFLSGDVTKRDNALCTISKDVKLLRSTLPTRLVRLGEYEAARLELIEWATKIRGMAWEAKNPDATLRAALAVARAKGFDLSTAAVRQIPDAPDRAAVAQEERDFIASLPVELQREFLLWTEGRPRLLPKPEVVPATLDSVTDEPEEAN